MFSKASEISSGLIVLKRDCEATLIPYGNKVTLKAGEEVRITQALGGNYTVVIRGNLVRIVGKDADALGMESAATERVEKTKQTGGPVDEQAVWEVMKTCYDPEIPVNIVDLGLIYSCEFSPSEEGSTEVQVRMTLTAPGCGMGGPLSEELRQKILDLPGVSEVEVELVWDPPWNRDMMSDAAKLQLGML
ncbi:MAG: putative Fe-S cluster assembly protein SufT [Candidatus Neomarinimicrobiota bacterium]